MNGTPLFSIITVTYNAGTVVGTTLESIVDQSFRGFEYIVADGASTDNTLDILGDYKSRIPAMSVVSEPDKGLYFAMNKALERATGKYVLFLNAGDAFHSQDTLALYARAAHSNPAVIYADTDIVDINRRFIKHRHLSAPEQLSAKSFANGMLVCHQAFMLRRDLAEKYDTSYRFSADYDWCVRALKKMKPGESVNLHTVAIDYLADGLTDKNHRRSLIERFKIMCRHFGVIPTVLRHIGFMFRAFRRRF